MLPERFETARLTLRPFVQEDAAAVYAYWCSDSGWEQFNASVPANFTQTDAEQFVAGLLSRDRAIRPSWAILFQQRVVGVVSLSFEQEHNLCVIGYGVHGDLRGRGVTAEAVQVFITQAFRIWPQLHQFRAYTDARNAASIRVLEKLGFAQDGPLPINQGVEGDVGAGLVFGLLRPDWAAEGTD